MEVSVAMELIYFIAASFPQLLNLSELILFIDQYLLSLCCCRVLCSLPKFYQFLSARRMAITRMEQMERQKKYGLNDVINSLTIMRIIQICYLVPSIKPYRIYNCLMVVRSHTNGEVEETWWRRKNLKLNRINFSCQDLSCLFVGRLNERSLRDDEHNIAANSPSPGTKASRTASGMCYCTSGAYQRSPAKPLRALRRRPARIDCIL